jgi:hypothetical protein
LLAHRREGLLDHLVGADDDAGWDLNSHRASRPEIDDKFNASRAFDGQIVRWDATQDLSHASRSAALNGL